MNIKQQKGYPITLGGSNDVCFVKILNRAAVLATTRDGWKKELNIVQWNGADPKYDIREWSPDHKYMSRGITLSEDEMNVLLQTAPEFLQEATEA